MTYKQFCFVVGFVVSIAFLSGCGGGSGQAAPPATVEQGISASTGGQVSSTSGEAVLNIPANALSQDSPVNLTLTASEELPEQDSLASRVFTIGANAQLQSVVTLTLSLNTILPDNRLAFVARLQGDEWVLLRHTVANGNQMSATIDQFATYALITRPGVTLSAGVAAQVEADGDDDVVFRVPAGAFATETRITLTRTEEDDEGEDDDGGGDDNELEVEQYELWASQPLASVASLAFEIDDGIPLGRKGVIERFDGVDWTALGGEAEGEEVVVVNLTQINTQAPQSYRVQLVSSGVTPLVTSIGPACDPNLTEQTLSFVHVADLHAHFHEGNKYGKIRAYYNQAKINNPYTLFSNGGDDYEKGSIVEENSQGSAVITATEAMKFDVRVIGNHDFAWGAQQLLEFADDPHGVVVLSNAEYLGEDPSDFAAVRYTEFEMGCARVGVFGMVSEPWNEFDEQYIGDYLPEFKMDWAIEDLTRLIVAQYRQNVDVMVMLSHLGVGPDIQVAQAVDGIDLVLGGHTHGGASIADDENDTIVIQPDFYGDGVTQIDVTVDLVSRELTNYSYLEQPVAELTSIDTEVKTVIDGLIAQYAPDAFTPIATIESTVERADIPIIAAEAGIYAHQADAALLSPDMTSVIAKWPQGEVNVQAFYDAYQVERQLANTPGTSAMYTVEVSGSELSTMIAAQPTWIYSGVQSPVADQNYKVVLHKASALNGQAFFGEQVSLANVQLASETYWALQEYAINRTTSCVYFDSATALGSCQLEQSRSAWNFNDLSSPLTADNGPAFLSYRDPNQTGWGPQSTVFGSTTTLGLPDLPDGPANVMGFAKTTAEQGYTVTHNVAPNGDYATNGKISDYTIVLDLLWPAASDGQWRSLLQTDPTNSDDGDWFTSNELSGGIGIIGYVGSLPPDTWHRIALVMYAAPEQAGEFKLFINGEMVGEGSNTDERWALDTVFHLFTDNRDETQAGFVSGIMFAGWPMTVSQIRQLGGPSKVLGFD